MATQKSTLAYLIPILLFAGLILLLTKELHPIENPDNGDFHTPLPVFSVPNLWAPKTNFTQADMNGQVSLLVVWGSWCPACRADIPMMVEIKNNFHVPIYSIIVNDDPDAAKEFLQQAGNPFVKTGVDDDDRIAKSLEVTATPSTFIIDKHGMVRYRYIGVISKSAWNEIIFPLVNQYKNES